MTEMTRALAATLRTDVEAALQDVAKKHGLSIKMGNANFSPSSLVQKVEFATLGEDGVVMNRSMEDLINNLWRLEITEADLGKAYNHPMLMGGRAFKIVGYRTRARKNPITVEMLDDSKRYVISLDAMRRCIADRKDAA